MNRRSFLQKAATCAAVATVAPAALAPVPPLSLDAFFEAAHQLKRARAAGKSVDVIHLGPFDPEFRDKLESAMRRYQSIHPVQSL